MVLSLYTWHKVEGSISPHVQQPRAEIFYWLTITFSQTLGTALGDWSSDTAGLGYTGGIMLYVILLGIVIALFFFTKVSRTLLFWTAFVLTRPLGAVVGDFLDKPLDHGGLALSRFVASAVLFIAILVCIYIDNRKKKNPNLGLNNT